MIQVEPLVSPVWAWLLTAAIVVIFSFQLFWILTSKLSRTKIALKVALNAALSLSLIGFIFQPGWKTSMPEHAILVYSSDVENTEINFWTDSLSLTNAIAFSDYKGEGNPVYLLGNAFSALDLMEFRDKRIHWPAINEPGSMSFLEWKGILRQGEDIALKGRIDTQDSVNISLSQQGELLAETGIIGNSGTFNLSVPARVLGRNELDLMVNDSLYGHINFFATAPKPTRYSLKFAFPDPEIRFLSQHLINAGEKVHEQIDISKNATIRSGTTDSDSLQFLVIDPSQLTKKETQEAIENGVSVLIINLNNVGNDIAAINRTFETNFKAKRITTEARREIASDLDADPYEFEPVIAQKLLYDNGFAVQQIGNSKVGISLLGKTFPIKLAGDSLRYKAIWNQLLGALTPQESNGVQLNQPIFYGMEGEIQIQKQAFLDNALTVELDSVFLQQSLINPYTMAGSFVSLDSGWVSIGDSLEFYSYMAREFPSLGASKLKADFLSGQSKKLASAQSLEFVQEIPSWVWLSLFLILFTLIWVEPKFFK